MPRYLSMADRVPNGEPLNDGLARLQAARKSAPLPPLDLDLQPSDFVPWSDADRAADYGDLLGHPDEEPSAPVTTARDLLAERDLSPESQDHRLPWFTEADGSTRVHLVLALDWFGSTYEQAWVGYESPSEVRRAFVSLFHNEEDFVSVRVTEISPSEVYRSGL